MCQYPGKLELKFWGVKQSSIPYVLVRILIVGIDETKIQEIKGSTYIDQFVINRPEARGFVTHIHIYPCVIKCCQLHE